MPLAKHEVAKTGNQPLAAEAPTYARVSYFTKADLCRNVGGDCPCVADHVRSAGIAIAQVRLGSWWGLYTWCVKYKIAFVVLLEQ